MRVYELSKLLGVSNKEILDFLKSSADFSGSHMSVVEDELIAEVENKFSVTKVKEPASSEKLEKKLKSKIKNIEKVCVDQTKEKSKPAFSKKDNSQPLIVAPMSVLDFCAKTNLLVSEVVLGFLTQGKMYNINHILTFDEVARLAEKYNIAVEKIGAQAGQLKKASSGNRRPPVVVVAGHVDHGKTTLLDFIRKSRVAEKEKGGITQHLGAYKVKTSHGDVVFLDTPGHETFSLMRSRGVRVADLVVLVVAADDGVMPQTIEVINSAQEMNVPVVVAINKADRVDSSRFEAVKTQLSRHGLLGEEWGGSVVMVPVSAKTGQGVDDLLEMLALQSEIMDIFGDPNAPAQGYVLEAHLEKGRGRVATFISQCGTLNSGDYFICGNLAGRVSLLLDVTGKIVKSALPSEPVKILGLDDLPSAGDVFRVVSQDEYKSFLKTHISNIQPSQRAEGKIPLIIKADNDSSREAIVQELKKKYGESVSVVSSGIGPVTAKDVELADSVAGYLYGFGVKFNVGVEALARQIGVSVKFFYIIYKLFDDVEQLIESKKVIEKVLVQHGGAYVKKVFKIKGIGVVAGFQVTSGKLEKGAQIEIFRENKKIGSGVIKSLQRDKKSAKEVAEGFEGAFFIDTFDDWKEGDIIKAFVEEPVKD